MNSDANRQSDTLAGDRAARQVIGHEVLQALLEIDRAIPAMSTTSSAPDRGAVGADTIQVPGFLGGLSPILVGTVSGLTDIHASAAPHAASLISAGISIRFTGRQTPG